MIGSHQNNGCLNMRTSPKGHESRILISKNVI